MSSPELLVDGPAVILVEPQLGENIGTAARAMANFGLRDLRIVNPRDGWPNESARRAASRADHVFDRIRLFDTVEAAVADLGYLVATTARSRELAKPVRGPASAAGIMRGHMTAGVKTGVLFGRERIGLTNEEISLADEIVTLPIDPQFASLNIAQAVLIVAYEWRRSGLETEEAGLRFAMPNDSRPATKQELLGLFEHLEGALDQVTFFRPVEKRPVVVQTLRAMLQRAQFTEADIRTLRGVIAALENRPTRPRKRADGTETTSREADD
ncbi:RNA methyltransferase [Kaistia adipata]|uniref:RNA methyltransferase n=1 Tax=Kaistia adipata TaxID=166954 RepID=UPI000A05EDE3|nr:RNA methyltransferase [Kaistia adipata]